MSPNARSARPRLPQPPESYFVHGCFWHRHARCALARLPKSRLEFWLPKLDANKRRDQKNIRALRRKGWAVLTIWEPRPYMLEHAESIEQLAPGLP